MARTFDEAVRSSLGCVSISKHLLSLGNEKKAVSYLDTVEHILAALCSQLTYLQRDNVFKALHLNIHNVLPEAAKGILDVEVHEESTRGNRPPLFGPKLIKKLEERGGSDLVSKLKRLRTPAKDTRGASSGQRRIEGGPPSKRLRADRQERQPAPRTTYESRASGRGSKPTVDQSKAARGRAPIRLRGK
ncbi:unnamed protein product, partial [Mesorhabditis belari]|uniref:Uncharacterized protein n=1 Tax=Mesorhabditis belari TaxID=2138241 RepID=A0AAF3J4B2_9BILA